MHRWLLLGLLVVAGILRFWDLPHIPYTHDEISALLRVHFSSFRELIAQGVSIDMHPAGVQVFEWMWAGLFGTGEAVVKTPFILLSIAALFFIYRFAATWTTPAAALLSIAFIGTIQYTVMYGQIARPYAVGFFTCALLMDRITALLGGRRWAWVGVGAAAVLCAYTHYFSMLFAGLAWLLALPLASGPQRKKLLLAGCLAVLPFAPHVPITVQQFSYKGLSEWLAPPDADWLPSYVAWIFQYSVPLAIVVAGISLTGWVRAFRERQGGHGPFIPLCLALGLIPLAIGYGYSIWRAPVLQFSVVIFSFPFLVLPLFAGWRNVRPGILSVLLVLITATAIQGLVSVRQHYTVFYRSKYEAAVHGIVEAAHHPDRAALLDMPDGVPEFYFKQWGLDGATIPYVNLHPHDPAYLDSVLRTTRATSVFYGATAGAEPEHLSAIQAAFPFMAERHDFVEGQTFLFTARPEGVRINDLVMQSLVAPEAIGGEGWNVDPYLPLFRDTTAHFGNGPRTWDLTEREFGAVFERPVYALAQGDNDVIEARMDVPFAAPGSELKLVMELKEGDRTVFYRSTTIHPSATTMLAAIKLADLPGHGQGTMLKAYLWNPQGKGAHIASLEVRTRKGDPWLYGFFQPLKAPLVFP